MSRVLLAALVAVVLVAGGCGGSNNGLAPVRGTVTIDNRPFSEGKVMFAPVAEGTDRNPGKPAFGLLGPDGTFVLTTYQDGDGARIGEHWVSVIRMEPGNDDLLGEAPAEPARPTPVGGPRFERITYPQKVSVVADGENDVTISLTSQDVARYGR